MDLENLIDDVRDEQEILKEELIKRQMDKIKKAKENGNRSTLWYGDEQKYKAIEKDVARMFERKGYKIKPTGYIGGVWQLSYDICW